MVLENEGDVLSLGRGAAAGKCLLLGLGQVEHDDGLPDLRVGQEVDETGGRIRDMTSDYEWSRATS